VRIRERCWFCQGLSKFVAFICRLLEGSRRPWSNWRNSRSSGNLDAFAKVPMLRRPSWLPYHVVCSTWGAVGHVGAPEAGTF
jgi:hypothetical protein